MENVKKQLLQAAINHGSMPMDMVTEIIAKLCDACKDIVPDTQNLVS